MIGSMHTSNKPLTVAMLNELAFLSSPMNNDQKQRITDSTNILKPPKISFLKTPSSIQSEHIDEIHSNITYDPNHLSRNISTDGEGNTLSLDNADTNRTNAVQRMTHKSDQDWQAKPLPTKEQFKSYDPYNHLSNLLSSRQATVAVIGLGYVGLPLIIALHRTGFSVLGFDVDHKKIEALQNGKSYIADISDKLVQHMQDGERFQVTCDPTTLGQADALVICVPTPLTRNREPDMSHVTSVAHLIAARLCPGQLIVLESTTYPGTTAELIQPILEQTGLKMGKDFFLAYSPEREDPGNFKYSIGNPEAELMPRILGADDEASRELALLLFTQLVPNIFPVSSSAAAEAVKLTENIFRSVNIALVNELKMVYDKMGIDIWEVIEAAKTKPFGYMPFYPGPGLGGHCIPIDPFYLTWKAREFGLSTRFVELSGQINNAMPSYVIERLREELDQRFSKGLNGARLLLVGLAYKKNIDDMRESPGLIIYEKLLQKGGIVDYFDPFIPVIPSTREHPNLSGLQSIEWSAAKLGSFDAAVICTDHDGVDYELLVQLIGLVVDTRNATASVKHKTNVVKA
jgi:UDP-N-acetyl-D-glucosamine dehydrogenase